MARHRRARREDEVSPARIRERLKRLGPQDTALALGLRSFTDDEGALDRTEWDRAFGSSAPEDILAVAAVKSLFEGLTNHIVEMLRVGAALRGLAAGADGANTKAPELIRAVRDDGGLSEAQAKNLIYLSRGRNAFQHDSPGVESDDALEDIALLRETLGGFAQSFVTWLAEHDVQIIPPR